MQDLPEGIWPVMLTPFQENGGIDFNGLRLLTEFYLASGASGLFANCLSSEMYQLSPTERLEVTKAVVRAADGEVPVVSTGNFSREQDVNVEFMSKIFDQGVQGVVINTSQLCHESEGEDIFRERMENLVDACVEMPLGIYECPEPYKRPLTKDMLARMAASGRFSYFKDTSCNNEQIRDRLSVSTGSPLALFNANTPTALQSLRDGAAGLSPIGANFFPELFYFLYEHAMEEQTEAVERVHRFLSVSDLVVHALYPFSAKWFLQQRGLDISTITRQTIPRPAYDEMIRLHDLLSMMDDVFEATGVKSTLPTSKRSDNLV